MYAYLRELDGKRVLVLLNFMSTDGAVKTDLDLGHATVLAGNYAQPSRDGRLRPYEAVMLQL